MFYISHRLYSISVAYGLPRIGQIYVRGNAGLRNGLARGGRLSLTAPFPVPGGNALAPGPDRITRDFDPATPEARQAWKGMQW
jgi:hypothetical protein